MTEKNAAPNHSKKNQIFLTKFVILLSLIFFGYLGFKYWKIEREKTSQHGTNLEKTNNSEGSVLELSDEYKNQNHQVDLSELTVNELKEKGAEFVYQMLLKNQVQIEDLRAQIQDLKAEMVKNKNQERIGKMILIYVNLRQEFLAEKNYNDELKNFEIITAFDGNLQSKIARLKILLPKFSTQEKLQKSFKELIPDLITNKNNTEQEKGLIAKIRHNLSKLIVIRKVDGKNPQEVDSVIVAIEKSLRHENYQEALNQALSLDENYHEILKSFLDDLSTALEVQKLDAEILNYLKSLT